MLLVPPTIHIQGKSSRNENVKPSLDPFLGGLKCLLEWLSGFATATTTHHRH